MAIDNDTKDLKLDLNEKAVEELRAKYQEALAKHRSWVDFQNKRLSTNFVTYVLAYQT